MTPKWLIAEGPMPGRPTLSGKKILAKVSGKLFCVTALGKVIHEDPSGIVLQKKTGEQLPFAYPFNYQVVEDA